jgi:hypothetical protein
VCLDAERLRLRRPQLARLSSGDPVFFLAKMKIASFCASNMNIKDSWLKYASKMRIEWLTYAPTLFKLRIEMTTIFCITISGGRMVQHHRKLLRAQNDRIRFI